MLDMIAIAKRSDSVWLLADDWDSETARVLDLEQQKLFPPYNRESILARGDWFPIDENEEQPDVQGMLDSVANYDTKARDDSHDPGSVPGARVV